MVIILSILLHNSPQLTSHHSITVLPQIRSNNSKANPLVNLPEASLNTLVSASMIHIKSLSHSLTLKLRPYSLLIRKKLSKLLKFFSKEWQKQLLRANKKKIDRTRLLIWVLQTRKKTHLSLATLLRLEIMATIWALKVTLESIKLDEVLISTT